MKEQTTSFDPRDAKYNHVNTLPAEAEEYYADWTLRGTFRLNMAITQGFTYLSAIEEINDCNQEATKRRVRPLWKFVLGTTHDDENITFMDVMHERANEINKVWDYIKLKDVKIKNLGGNDEVIGGTIGDNYFMLNGWEIISEVASETLGMHWHKIMPSNYFINIVHS